MFYIFFGNKNSKKIYFIFKEKKIWIFLESFSENIWKVFFCIFFFFFFFFFFFIIIIIIIFFFFLLFILLFGGTIFLIHFVFFESVLSVHFFFCFFFFIPNQLELLTIWVNYLVDKTFFFWFSLKFLDEERKKTDQKSGRFSRIFCYSKMISQFFSVYPLFLALLSH